MYKCKVDLWNDETSECVGGWVGFYYENTNPVNSKTEFTIVKSLIIKGNPRIFGPATQ